MRDIHPMLFKRLQNLTIEYENVTAFAELLPLFADKIIAGEFTSDGHRTLTHRYKQLNLQWGVNWTLHEPTNFPEKEEFHKGLISIYINCCNLFNDNVYDLAHRELDEATKDMLCYYTDYSNTTFYFKPDEIEAGLELLNRWYINVELKSIDYTNKQKRANLLKQLQELDTE